MELIKRLSPVLLLTFVNVIGFTLLIPVLPTITEELVGNDLQPVVYGLSISAYAFFQFLAAPIIGSLSDKYGRKNLLVISQFGTTISWIIFGLAWFLDSNVLLMGIPIPLLVISFARITDGITGGNISVANAWVSDMSSRKEKTAAFGLVGATFGSGFLIGPVIGGISAATYAGYLGTAVVAFWISMVTLIYVMVKLPESLPKEKRDTEVHMKFMDQINIIKQIRPFKYNRNISYLLLLRVFSALVFSSYTTIIILLLEREYGLSEYEMGLLLTVIAVFSIFNQALVVRKLVHKYGNFRTLYIGIASIILGLVTIPLLPVQVNGSLAIGIGILVVNAYFLNLGISVGQPTFKSLLTNEVDETKQGKITGLDESLMALGQGISPILAGILYTFLNVSTFYLFALMLLIPAIYAYIELNGRLHVQKHN